MFVLSRAVYPLLPVQRKKKKIHSVVFSLAHTPGNVQFLALSNKVQTSPVALKTPAKVQWGDEQFEPQ